MKSQTPLTRPRTTTVLADDTQFKDVNPPAAGYGLSIMPGLDIAYLNQHFEHTPTEEILEWAWTSFGPQAMVSSSFQTSSVPLLHIVSRVCPKMPVLFIDTGFHFLETLAFRDELEARYSLNIQIIHPSIEKNQLLVEHGGGLYRSDPDLCCHINKVEPMQRASSRYQAWVAGVRRDQTAHRQTLNVLEPQSSGLLKIHPMINWTKNDIWEYIHKHRLPSHPLFAHGYLSVGCTPCTRPVPVGEDERAGRWAGTKKNECGLHTAWTNRTEEQGAQTAE